MLKSELNIIQIRAISDRFLELSKTMKLKKNEPIYNVLHNAYWFGVLRTLEEVKVNKPHIILESIKEGLNVSDVLMNIKK